MREHSFKQLTLVGALLGFCSTCSAISIQFDFGTAEGNYTGIQSPAHQVGELTVLENKWNSVGTTSVNNFPQETQPGGNDSLSFVYADGTPAFGIQTDFGAFFDGLGATMRWDANEIHLAQFGDSQTNPLYNNSLGKDLLFNQSGGSVAFRTRGFSAGTYDVFAINTLSDRTSAIRVGVNMNSLADDLLPESVGPIGTSTTWVQGENYGRQQVSVTGPSDWITVFSTVTSGPNSVLSGVQITSDVPPPPPPPVFTPNATRTENFNTALSSRFVNVNTPQANEDQNFGFSNTNHAGGTAGEAGGTFVRASSADAYADVDLTNGTSGDFDRTKTLTLSGKFSVTGSTNPNNTVFVGYVNDSITSNQLIGFTILEASPGVFRGQLSIQQADGTRFRPENNVQINQGTDYTFDLTYVGNPDGSGTLSGMLGGVFKTISAPASSDRFDKFGIGAAFDGSDSSTNVINAFFDDLTYSIYVPEPSAFMLATCGLFALVARRRGTKHGGRCRSES